MSGTMIVLYDTLRSQQAIQKALIMNSEIEILIKT